MFSSVAAITLQGKLLLVWAHSPALYLLRWFSPSKTHSIQRLYLERSCQSQLALSIKHLLSVSKGGPPRGHLPFADYMKELGCSAWSKDSFRESYSNSRCSPGSSQGAKSGSLQWWQNKRQWSNRNKTGYRETPLFPQGHPCSTAGCPKQSCFHPQRFSRPSRISPGHPVQILPQAML